MYNITENKSPYFTKFNFDGMTELIDFVKQQKATQHFLKPSDNPFVHYKFPVSIARQILDLVPMDFNIALNVNRVSFFITQPGFYYPAHIDGGGNGPQQYCSINIPISILDETCETSWYDYNIGTFYEVSKIYNNTTDLEGFVKENHEQTISTTMTMNDCMLINTGVWHDFDNRQSDQVRIILTLRPNNMKMTYEEASNILFG